VGVVHSGVVQAIVQAVVEARVDRLGNNGGLDNSLGNSWDNSLGSNGLDSWVVVSIDTSVSGVAVAIVVVEDGGVSLGVSLSLTLDEVGVVHSGVVQAIVQAVVEARVDDGGLDDSLGNSGDNGLGDSWDNSLGDNWELVVVHTSVGKGGLDTVVHGQGVSLGLSLTLEQVGVQEAIGVVETRVGDHWAGNGLDNGLGSHGLNNRDNGLVQVGGGLGVQVVNLGGLDGQGVVRDNSSIGMVHHTQGLGVGGAVDHWVGKKELGVSLGGSLGGSGHSNSDESLHG